MQTSCRLPPAALFLIAAAAAAPPAAGQTVTPSTDLAAIAAMAPRPAGSDAAAQVVRYVETRLQALSVRRAFHPFPAAGPRGALVATVSGRSDRTVALVVPLTPPAHAPPGRDGSAAIAAALHVVERASRNRLPLSLQAVFVSGGYGAAGGSAAPADSAALADSSVLRDAEAVVYLNLQAIPDRLVLRTDGRAAQTPYWLLQAAADAIDRAGLPFTVNSTANQLARIGLPLPPSMADPYLAAGYPAIELAGRYAGARAAAVDAWIEDFGAVIEGLTARADGAGEAWERHYLFVRFGDLRLALDEIGVVVSVASALALALAVAVLPGRRLRRHRRLLLLHAWLPPLAAAAVYGALTAATEALTALLAARELPLLWQRLPGPALAFKGATALLLVMAAAKLVAWVAGRFRRGADPAPDAAPRNLPEAGVLSAGAAALLPAAVAAAAAIDLAASLPFISAYAGVLLFCLTRLRAAKVVWLAAAAAAPAAAVADLIGAGAGRLLESLLIPSPAANALTTAALLPFVLMALRLTLRPAEPLAAWGTRRRLWWPILLAALISAAAGAALLLWPPEQAAAASLR